MAKLGMIDVGVAGDEDDIDLVPAARLHLRGRRRGQRGGKVRRSRAAAIIGRGTLFRNYRAIIEVNDE